MEQVQKATDAVWQDDDDDHINASLTNQPRLRKLRETEEETTVSGSEYTARLRKLRSGLVRTPKWADDARKRVEQTDELAYGMESYTVGSLDRTLARSAVSDVLLPDYLAISKKQTVTVPAATANCLDTVEFHPSSSNTLMTSGMDKNLHLFVTEGSTHERIFSSRFKDMPIKSSHFSADGQEIVSVGRRPFFYVTDIATEKVVRITGIKGRRETEWNTFCTSKCGKFLFFCGLDGNIVVLSARTKQWIADMKMNEPVHAVCVSPDSRHLFSAGGSGAVYVWDLTSFRCVKKFFDDGGTLATSISVSNDLSLLACGSSSGVVNMYDVASLLSSDGATPIKSYGSLVTPITGTLFHPSSQIMTFFSCEQRNALRMVHYPSGRVYSNWPTEQSPLGRVMSASYNATGDSAAFGSKNGAVQIYNLKHFARGDAS